MVKQFNIKKFLVIIIVCIIIAIIIYAVYTQIEDYSHANDPKLLELKEIFTKFFNTKRHWTGALKKLNNIDVMSDISLFRGDKSYTINKERVYICMKDENNEYYALFMLIYVLAHELSHVICESIGHTDEFNTIFEELLVELADAGIYDPSTPLLADYCHSGDKLQ